MKAIYCTEKEKLIKSKRTHIQTKLSSAEMFLPISVAPNGSLEAENRTGSCVVGVDRSVVAQAMLWDDPHATLVIL